METRKELRAIWVDPCKGRGTGQNNLDRNLGFREVVQNGVGRPGLVCEPRCGEHPRPISREAHTRYGLVRVEAPAVSLQASRLEVKDEEGTLLRPCGQEVPLWVEGHAGQRVVLRSLDEVLQNRGKPVRLARIL